MGVVVTLKELSFGRKYVVHHDRLSKLLLSGKEIAPRKLELNANPKENEQDSEEGMLPVGKSEEALMRIRSGRVVKSTRINNFDYSFMLACSSAMCPSISSSLEAYLQAALSGSSFILDSRSCPFLSVHTCFDLLPFTQAARIRRKQRAQVEQLGYRVYLAVDASGVEQMAFTYKPNGIVYVLDLHRQD